MMFIIKNKTPIVKLVLENKFGLFFEQEFLIDTWFTWFVIFYWSNDELLSKIRKTFPISKSKIDIKLWDWKRVHTLEWKTRFKINSEIDEVSFNIIDDKGRLWDFPVVWISFLDFFMTNLNFDFSKNIFSISFKKNS